MADAAATPFDIDAYLERRRSQIEVALEESLPPADAAPSQLHEAMRYSVFAGGKRLRPILALATAECLGSDDSSTVVELAAALELVHTYSLVHDDLPAMDDDDFRRGRPACHRRFGEGIAILAGNALLTLAFGKLATLDGVPPERSLLVQQHLLQAIGSQDGIIAGQAIDLLSAGRPIDATRLETMHEAKTGALIGAAVGCSARLCGADSVQQRALDDFGRAIGLAFQIVDDLLDVEGSTAELGKTTGQDQRHSKATYPALHGVTESRRRVKALTSEANSRLADLGSGAIALMEIGKFISVRRV